MSTVVLLPTRLAGAVVTGGLDVQPPVLTTTRGNVRESEATTAEMTPAQVATFRGLLPPGPNEADVRGALRVVGIPWPQRVDVSIAVDVGPLVAQFDAFRAAVAQVETAWAALSPEARRAVGTVTITLGEVAP
jgi:hypothetical protein